MVTETQLDEIQAMIQWFALDRTPVRLMAWLGALISTTASELGWQ